jgi:alpha-tubulin suppressor-like RCC1 family protein
MRLRRVLSLVTLLLATACTDHPDVTGVPGGMRPPRAARRVIAPGGTLDANIAGLLQLFPHGLATAGQARWDAVKRKYDAGLNAPSQMRVAQSMLFELAAWVRDHAASMNTPPDDETKTAAAARLTEYMALYVYGSPSTPVPTYTPAADNAVGLVTPQDTATVVTPTTRAGVHLDAGSVDESTIIVVTENPTPFPAACSGPLATRLCQYPRFYTFDEFPHKRLLKPAVFAVCHVNDGNTRQPLADHDRFRLAHAKPADPADYTPNSTIRDQNGESVEILPLVHQTFSTCEDVEYTASAEHGVGGMMHRALGAVGRALTPKLAYAIDQGGGGLSLSFSPFDVVDPLGEPDENVQSFTAATTAAHPGDHLMLGYMVNNVGTASAGPATAGFRLGTSPANAPTGTLLGGVTLPPLVPGQGVGTTNALVVVPPMPAGNYYLAMNVASDPAFPDAALANNVAILPIHIDDPFINAAPTMAVGEASVCALDANNALACWGWNINAQLGFQAGPDVTLPVVTSIGGLAKLDVGTGQSLCGIASSGAATCWGRDGFGELGHGTVGGLANPPGPVVGGISWAQIGVGRLSTCGVSISHQGYCWGSNQRGEVGTTSIPVGAQQVSATPQPTPIDGGMSFKSVVSGWLHACGIATTGAAYCWGDNSVGALGLGFVDSAAHRSPQAVVGGLSFIQLSVGARSTCGITVQHRAYCWGGNYAGQLGDGTTTARSSPTLVAGGEYFSFISTGSGFATGATPPLPTTAQGGVAHTCALAESGIAYCWGFNSDGQLGDGTTTSRTIPAPVSGGHAFSSIALGGAFGCGRDGADIWCWGTNTDGQLGNGTFTRSLVPSLVHPPQVPQ